MVTNDARCTIQDLRVGGSRTSVSNSVVVADGGVLNVMSTFRLGWGRTSANVSSGSFGNFVEIRENGRIETAGVTLGGNRDTTLNVGADGNRLIVGREGVFVSSGDTEVGFDGATNCIVVSGGVYSNANGFVTLGSSTRQADALLCGGNRIEVGPDSVFSIKDLAVGYRSPGNVVSLAGANVADISGDVLVGTHDTVSTGNRFEARDMPSLLVAGAVSVGDLAADASFSVTNVRRVVMDRLYVGCKGANAHAEVLGAEVFDCATVVVGTNTAATGASFVLGGADGLTFAKDKMPLDGGSGIEFGVAENCSIGLRDLTWKPSGATGLFNFKPTATGQEFVIGPGARLETKGQYSFQVTPSPGRVCALVVDGGVVDTLGSSPAVGISGKAVGTRLEVVNGGEIRATNGSFIVGSDAAGSAHKLLVGDRARIESTRIRLCNHDMTCVISNGTIKVGEFATAYLENAIATNNHIVFRGSAPQLIATSNLSIGQAEKADKGIYSRGTVLEFAVPAEGYDPDTPPIQSTYADSSTWGFSIPSSTRIRADIAAFQEAGGGKTILAREVSGRPIRLLSTTLEEIGSDLPEGCRLMLKNDGSELWLKTPSNKGLVLIVR